MATNGKWVASSCEDVWDDVNEFDTPEDATAYALDSLAEEHGKQPGDHVYIGQADEITKQEMGDAVADAYAIIDAIDSWIYDEVGYLVDYELKVTPEQTADLQGRLDATVVAWLTDHGLGATVYRIENVKSITVPGEAPMEDVLTPFRDALRRDEKKP
jgi:hypothetical protein